MSRKSRANKPHWPAFYFAPGGTHRIFNSADEVPNGWFATPQEAEAAKPAGKTAPAQLEAGAGANNAELDAHGHPWDAEKHASTKAKTQAGLWRMKVGVARPDPAPGYPLDL